MLRIGEPTMITTRECDGWSRWRASHSHTHALNSFQRQILAKHILSTSNLNIYLSVEPAALISFAHFIPNEI